MNIIKSVVCGSVLEALEAPRVRLGEQRESSSAILKRMEEALLRVQAAPSWVAILRMRPEVRAAIERMIGPIASIDDIMERVEVRG